MSSFDMRVGDFGNNITATLIDKTTNAAFDVSGFPTRQIILIDPTGNETVRTATFVTDGTDGKITYVTESGVIDEAGTWRFKGRVINGATSQYTSTDGTFIVGL